MHCFGWLFVIKTIGNLIVRLNYFKKLLRNEKSLYGENDRNTLISMNNLASCYEKKGMLEEAIKLHTKTLEKEKSLFGENDRNTLTSMQQLSILLSRKRNARRSD